MVSGREVSIREPEGRERFETASVDEFDTFRIPVYTAKDLYELPLPQEDPELVGPFLRRGRITLLGATTGHGKTTFGVQMLAAGVLGGDFLGWQVRGAGACSFSTSNSTWRTSRSRCGRRARRLGAPRLRPIPEGLQIDREPEHLAALERVVAAKPYDLVRIDPFYKLHAADSSDEEQARDLVRLTRGWVNRHGFGLLMDTHTRKRIEGRAGFTLDDLFGSSLFSRDPETILGLQLIEEGFTRLHVFKARGRRGQIRTGQAIDLLYSDDALFRRKPDEPERELRAELLERAADHAWRTLKEWKAEVGASEEGNMVRGGIARRRAAHRRHYGVRRRRRRGAARRGEMLAPANCPGRPGHLRAVGQFRGSRGSDDAAAAIPSPPVGGRVAGQQQRPLGRDDSLRCPGGVGAPKADRPPPGFWRDARTGKERRATEHDLREANRLLAKHRDVERGRQHDPDEKVER